MHVTTLPRQCIPALPRRRLQCRRISASPVDDSARSNQEDDQNESKKTPVVSLDGKLVNL